MAVIWITSLTPDDGKDSIAWTSKKSVKRMHLSITDSKQIMTPEEILDPVNQRPDSLAYLNLS